MSGLWRANGNHKIARHLCCLIAWLSLAVGTSDAAVTWISSTGDQPWQVMTSPSLTSAAPNLPPQVRIATGKTFQTIDGFGGCFNELSWAALGKAAPADRERILSDLFGDDGCAFTKGGCRSALTISPATGIRSMKRRETWR